VIEPGLSQVVTLTPSGTQPRWLGALGHVENLQYSWVNPGGADQLSCTLQLPASTRTDALNPGRQCQVWRGGSLVWDGKLLEPSADSGGWQVQAAGIGTAGGDFRAYYTGTWGADKNVAVNDAIGRGLRWVNPGITSPVWFGQLADPASITITDLLNLFCTKGGLTWYVTTGNYGNSLSVYAFPSSPSLSQVNRVLVSSTPVARTLGGDYDYLWLRYQSNDSTTAAPAYATTTVSNTADIAAHGQVEDYDDVSSSGYQLAATVQAAGSAILNRYQRAAFAGPFTVRYGELLTAGGAACDLGIDHCSTIVRLVLADFGYGGEVVPDPVIFLTGAYQWDEQSQTAQVTPFQSLDLSMSGLLTELATTLPPRPKPVRRVTVPRKPAPRHHAHHHTVPRKR
jgi:hypothetical protein